MIIDDYKLALGKLMLAVRKKKNKSHFPSGKKIDYILWLYTSLFAYSMSNNVMSTSKKVWLMPANS